MRKFTIVVLAAILIFSTSYANNIQVSNIGITGQNTAQQFSLVKFDLSWENSWRISVGPSNWDAAWVFIKYRVNSGSWEHARLNYVNGTADGHTAPAGVTVKTPNDALGYGMGVFIHRSADGSGNVNWQNIQLRWNYGLTGVGNNDLVDVQVFAIEMVYVPQGSFLLGGGTGTENGKFYTHPTTTTSYNVTSEAAIPVGTVNGNLYYSNTGVAGTATGDQAGPIPAAFPKGFNAFYCQKYEMSQDQWVSFFNTLTSTQKTTRNNTASVTTITLDGAGNATTTAPDRAMNFVGANDGNAYMDWAGLRPLTELEYEKACRGTLPVVANSFAWGNTNIYGTVYTIANAGTANETITNMGVSTGNTNYGATNIGRPLRCGIFAASATNKTREETGGSYYGIMELSGNLWDNMVGVGSPATRSFTGLHGNGVLTAAGESDVVNWNIEGGVRGGSYLDFNISYITISDRRIAMRTSIVRAADVGFRAGRSNN